MDLVHLDPAAATPVRRAGCTGMQMIPISHGETWDATALFFSPHASSDDHAAPFDESLVVTQGQGWVSLGDDIAAVRAGDKLAIPRNTFHRYWTGDESMAAIAFSFDIVTGPGLVRVPDRTALARNGAERFLLIARRAIADHGVFQVALSGGNTPRDLYALLASPEFASLVDWSAVHFFWGDERAVPPDDPASNYRMAFEALLSHVPVPPENVHRIPAEQGAKQAAADYEEILRAWFRPPPDTPPPFDLILLGLGENGHTASLFPHTPVLHETQSWVAASYVNELGTDRITLTVPVVNAAENIVFLVAGAEKATAVRAVLRGEYRPEDLPAQLIQPTVGRVVWLLDARAAQGLEE